MYSQEEKREGSREKEQEEKKHRKKGGHENGSYQEALNFPTLKKPIGSTEHWHLSTSLQRITFQKTTTLITNHCENLKSKKKFKF
jgi:hypothetical protein